MSISSAIGLIILASITCITLSVIITTNAMENMYEKKLYKRQTYKDIQTFEEDFPGLLECPCCHNKKINAITTISIPDINTFDGSIEFCPNDISLEYNIECSECGMQTKKFGELSEAILYWNGKSNSTQIIPRGN